MTSSLHEAVSKNDRDLVESLLKQNVEINARDHSLRTPLHIAVEQKNSGMVLTLITYGADVKARQSRGLTPLHIAVKYNEKRICHILLKNGADINSKDIDQCTPLHYSCQLGFQVIARLLIQKGAILVSLNNRNQSALHLATQSVHKDLVSVLIVEGVSVHGIDIYGRQPLHWAAINGYPDIVKLLLEKQANPNFRDYAGETPLQLAVKKGHLEVAAILERVIAMEPELEVEIPPTVPDILNTVELPENPTDLNTVLREKDDQIADLKNSLSVVMQDVRTLRNLNTTLQTNGKKKDQELIELQRVNSKLESEIALLKIDLSKSTQLKSESNAILEQREQTLIEKSRQIEELNQKSADELNAILEQREQTLIEKSKQIEELNQKSAEELKTIQDQKLRIENLQHQLELRNYQKIYLKVDNSSRNDNHGIIANTCYTVGQMEIVEERDKYKQDNLELLKQLKTMKEKPDDSNG